MRNYSGMLETISEIMTLESRLSDLKKDLEVQINSTSGTGSNLKFKMKANSVAPTRIVKPTIRVGTFEHMVFKRVSSGTRGSKTATIANKFDKKSYASVSTTLSNLYKKGFLMRVKKGTYSSIKNYKSDGKTLRIV